MESKTEKVLKVLDKLYEKEKKYSSKDPALVKKYQKQYSNNFMFDAWKGVHPVLNVSIGDKYDWRKNDYWVFERVNLKTAGNMNLYLTILKLLKTSMKNFPN